MKKKPKKKFKRIETFKLESSSLNTFTSVGNVEYNLLTQSAGDNYSIKVNLPHLMKIINQPILYSARIDNDKATATITVKEKDKAFLVKLLDFEKIQNQLEQQNETIQNRAMYRDLKREAEKNGTKLDYLMVNPKQLDVLKQNYIDMAYFPKGEKFNVSFLPEKKELIQKLLFPPVSKVETEKQKNNRIYAEIKKLAAQKNEKLNFKLKLTSEQLQALRELGIKFAYFTNSDDNSLYNVAFEKSNMEQVNEALNKSKKLNR